ncbi:MAG TPA: PAS domain S-box protein, partial [Thermoanaerobaculia bacterium]
MRVADVEAAGAAHPAEPSLLVVENEEIETAAARCRALRALPAAGRSYLLAVAPDAAAGGLAKLIAAGADDALPSPVDVGALDLRLAVAARRLDQLAVVARRLDQLAARPVVEHAALRRIVDTMSDSLAVEEALRLTQFSIDRSAEPAFWFHPDGRFFYVNEAASRLLGYEREELLALRVQDVVPDFPDDRFAALAEQIRQQSAITLETQHRGKDGRLFPAEITVNHLRFGGGEYFCGFTRDVSARKRVEQALRESEERYRSLFEGVPVGLYRTTPAGDMLEANSEMARILGYPSREALMGINAAELYLEPEERARWQQAIDAEHTVQTPETRLWRRDGTVIWVRLSVQAVRDEHGAIRRYDGAMEDVTERRLARLALLASEERFRALVQNASDMISILSPDGSLLYESPSHERVL